jgi:hypothetical protein
VNSVVGLVPRVGTIVAVRVAGASGVAVAGGKDVGLKMAVSVKLGVEKTKGVGAVVPG